MTLATPNLKTAGADVAGQPLTMSQHRPLKSMAQRLCKSAFVANLLSVTGSNVAARLIGLIALGYPARVLGPENYGLVGFGMSVTAYASLLLSPGLLTWGTRAIARNPQKAGEIMMLVRLFQCVFSIIAYGALMAYAFVYLPKSESRWVTLLCGLALFSTAASIDWVFNGLELMRIPALIAVGVSIINVVGLFVFVRQPNDLYVYAFLAPLTSMLGILVSYIICLRRLTPRWPGMAILKSALWDSLPLSCTMALVVVLHYTNNLIIHYCLGAAALGTFLAGYRLLELVGQIPALISNVVLPRLSRMVVQNTKLAREEALAYANVLIIAGLFIGTFLFAEAEGIVNLIYGSAFTSTIPLLKLMSIAVVFNFAIIGYTNALIPFGIDRVMLGVVSVSALVSVLGGLLLVPRYGTFGAGVVITAIDFSGWLVSIPSYHRVIGRLNWPFLLQGIGAALASIIVEYGLQYWHFPFWARLPITFLVFTAFNYRNIKYVYGYIIYRSGSAPDSGSPLNVA